MNLHRFALFLLCLVAVSFVSEAVKRPVLDWYKPQRFIGRKHSPRSAHSHSGQYEWKGAGPIVEDAVNLPDQWFDQILDHFDPLCNTTWKQLYYVNDQYFKPGGPLFFYFNGEGPLSERAVLGGELVNLAQIHNGIVVSHEHRYYGKSKPTPDMTTENMRFLSVEQALADAAYFQVEFAKSYGLPSTTKNVIVGGSYSGALSAFYRIKYPDLVHLSYASSGVVHAVEDFDMYFVTVRNDTKPYVNCEDYVVSMTEKVAKMLQNPTDRATLLKTFDLCGYTNDDTDVWYAISGALEGAAQYGMIEGACEVITSESDPVAGYAKFFLQSANAYGMGDGCVPLDWVTDLQNTTWDNIEIGGRSWFWQKCTEFGFFKTPNKSGIFSPSADLEYHLDACRAIFGRPLEPNTDWINISYGGDHPHGRRIVYANGSVDPWHNLGVLSSLSSSQIAVFIDGTSHCQDLDTPSSTDPKPLHDAHILIESLIAKWLQEE